MRTPTSFARCGATAGWPATSAAYVGETVVATAAAAIAREIRSALNSRLWTVKTEGAPQPPSKQSGALCQSCAWTTSGRRLSPQGEWFRSRMEAAWQKVLKRAASSLRP